MTDSFDAPPPGQSPTAGVAAAFGPRLVARLIDTGILIGLIIGLLIVSAIVGFVSDTLGALLLILGYLVIFAVAIYMIVGGVALTGQSPGQRMQGVKIVTDSGALLGWGPSAIRWFLGGILNSVLCGLPVGSLWMLWDGDKKTLYDKFTNNQAIVVPKGAITPIFPGGKPF